MSPNVDLLWRTQRQIEADPEHHVQRTWQAQQPECGTTRCFGGWAIVLGGGEMNPDKPSQARPVAGEGPWLDTLDVARKMLGLTMAQAHQLFLDISAEPAELRSLVEHYAGPEPAGEEVPA